MFPAAVVHFYLHHLWSMTWIHTTCTLWRKKKNRSAYCATTWHWEHQAMEVMCAETCATIAYCILNMHTYALLSHCPLTGLFSFTGKLVLEHHILQVKVALCKSNLASLPTNMYLNKKKKLEMSNRKVRIYERRKMCCCKVNPVRYRRDVRNDLKASTLL